MFETFDLDHKGCRRRKLGAKCILFTVREEMVSVKTSTAGKLSGGGQVTGMGRRWNKQVISMLKRTFSPY